MRSAKEADSGDLANWLPGGGKQKGQATLGADWPGNAVDASAVKASKGRKRKKARARSAQ